MSLSDLVRTHIVCACVSEVQAGEEVSNPIAHLL